MCNIFNYYKYDIIHMKSRVITNLKKDTNIAITFTEDENEITGEKMILNKAKNSPKKVTKVYAKKKLQSEKDTDPEKPELAEDDSQIEKNKCIIEKNNDTTQRLIAIDKILELYPQLKKDKKQIMDVVLDKKINRMNEHVLEKLVFKGKNFYKDESGSIINEKLEVVGLYTIDDSVHQSYYFFDELKKFKARIEKNMKEMSINCFM